MTPSTAIQLRRLPSLPTADGIRAMRELATEICKTEFVPQGFRGRPDAVLAAFAYGRELGFQPMTALKYLDNIQGQITVKPRAMSALIRSAGHTLKYPEVSPTKVVVYGKRRDSGEEMTVTWTIEQARRAGLVRDGGGWTKYPEDMLVARATGTIGRRLFEDVVLGLYAPEEMGGEPDEGEIIDAKAEPVDAIPEEKEAMPSVTPTPQIHQVDAAPPVAITTPDPIPPAAPAPKEVTQSSSIPTPTSAAPVAVAATSAPAITSAPPPTVNTAPPFTGDNTTALRQQALKLATDSQRIAAEQKYPGQSFSQHQLEAVARRSIEKWLHREHRAAQTLQDATEQDLRDVIEAIERTLKSAA